MRDRTGEPVGEASAVDDEMKPIIYGATGLCGGDADLFHLKMWAFVHGIATMFATGFLDLEWELVSNMITDCYQGMRKQHGLEG